MNTNKIKIGSITLKQKREFTQYTECAAWTSYVTCEPQTVDLFTDGYWAFCSFHGKLTAHTFPREDHFHKIGQDDRAAVQTQMFGFQWGDTDSLFRVDLAPEWTLEKVGEYSAECGQYAGKPMLAIKTATQKAA